MQRAKNSVLSLVQVHTSDASRRGFFFFPSACRRCQSFVHTVASSHKPTTTQQLGTNGRERVIVPIRRRFETGCSHVNFSSATPWIAPGNRNQDAGERLDWPPPPASQPHPHPPFLCGCYIRVTGDVNVASSGVLVLFQDMRRSMPAFVFWFATSKVSCGGTEHERINCFDAAASLGVAVTHRRRLIQHRPSKKKGVTPAVPPPAHHHHELPCMHACTHRRSHMSRQGGERRAKKGEKARW